METILDDMREILFRGKRTDGKWIQGHFCGTKCDGSSIAVIGKPETNARKVHHVFSETVGQFTGLKDKNGKKIFEGDIIDFKANYTSKPCGRMTGVVAFDEYGLILKTSNEEYNVREETDDFPYTNEITGNIHDQ